MKIERFGILKTIMRIVFAFAIFMSLELLIIYAIETNYNKEEFYMTVDGYVTEVTIDLEEDDLLFKLEGYEQVFTGFMKRDEVVYLSNILKVGDHVEIVVTEKRFDQKNVPIIKLKLNGIETVDLVDDNAKLNKSLLTVGICLACLSVIVLSILLILRNKIYYKEVDYLEYVLPLSSFSFINKKGKNIRELEKNNVKIIFGYIGFLLLLIIGIAITGSMYPDYPHIIIPICVILFITGTYLLFRFTVMYKSTDEDIKEFVRLYKEYLDGKTDYGIPYAKQQFTKDGYMFYNCDYEDYNDALEEFEYDEDIDNVDKTIIPYEDLNLYATCVYKNNFHYAHIFICSDHKEFHYPYHYQLNPVFYKQIKELNIEVKNLDYLLENLENEIKNNKPKIKFKVVKYK